MIEAAADCKKNTHFPSFIVILPGGVFENMSARDKIWMVLCMRDRSMCARVRVLVINSCVDLCVYLCGVDESLMPSVVRLCVLCFQPVNHGCLTVSSDQSDWPWTITHPSHLCRSTHTPSVYSLRGLSGVGHDWISGDTSSNSHSLCSGYCLMY